jgi:hypothetical protein
MKGHLVDDIVEIFGEAVRQVDRRHAVHQIDMHHGDLEGAWMFIPSN